MNRHALSHKGAAHGYQDVMAVKAEDDIRAFRRAVGEMLRYTVPWLKLWQQRRQGPGPSMAVINEYRLPLQKMWEKTSAAHAQILGKLLQPSISQRVEVALTNLVKTVDQPERFLHWLTLIYETLSEANTFAAYEGRERQGPQSLTPHQLSDLRRDYQQRAAALTRAYANIAQQMRTTLRIAGSYQSYLKTAQRTLKAMQSIQTMGVGIVPAHVPARQKLAVYCQTLEDYLNPPYVLKNPFEDSRGGDTTDPRLGLLGCLSWINACENQARRYQELSDKQ